MKNHSIAYQNPRRLKSINRYFSLITALVALVCIFSVKAHAQSPSYYHISANDSIPLSVVSGECAVLLKPNVQESYLNSLGLNYSHFDASVYIVSAAEGAVRTADTQNNLEVFCIYEDIYQNRIMFPNLIVVRYATGTSAQAKSVIESTYGLTPTNYSDHFDQYSVNGNPLTICAALYSHSAVSTCDPDFFMKYEPYSVEPNDTYFERQWNLNATTSTIYNDGNTGTIDADIDAPEAWELTTGDPTQIVAVCDGGLLADHEDLPLSKQVIMTDYLLNTNPERHTQAVAGIIGADINNCKGTVGIAPANLIMPNPLGFFIWTIVFEQGLPITSAYMQQMIVAGGGAARILNYSNSCPGAGGITTTSYLSFVNDVVHNPQNIPNYNGQALVIVCGVGTTANNNTGCYNSINPPSNPNALSSVPDVFLVGASDRNNQLADYSNWGPGLTISAPSATDRYGTSGGCTNTQIPGEAENHWTLDLPGNAGYNPYPDGNSNTLPQLGEQLPSVGPNHLDYTGRFYGTSAATPEVSGVAALCLGANSCLVPSDIWSIITSTADEVGGYNYVDDGLGTGETRSDELGYGKLNAHQAVLSALAIGGFNFSVSISDYICTTGDNATIQFVDMAGTITELKINGVSVDFSGDIEVPYSSDGKYYLQAIKADGCYSYREIWPESIVDVDLVSVSNSCPGLATGSIDVEITPQCSIPYSLAWSNNIETEDLSNVQTGQYDLTISQTNGCSTEQTFDVDYDLPSTMDEFFDQQVNISTNWDIPAGEYGFLQDLVIENGGELDIQPGAVLRFAPNAGIVVESGGMLIINGTTLTRFDCNPNFWRGIDVHDDGTVLTWDSFAEFALVGINNYDRSSGPANTAGGNIACWTTEFNDCQTAVRLRRKNGTTSYSSLASFKDCDFTWTNALPYINSFIPQPLIDSKESTVHFTFCDFRNENDELLSLTINHAHNPAIYSYRTRLSLIGNDGATDRNEMVGFRHGIVQHGGRAYVDMMDFNNFRSAYVVSSKGSRFTRSNFGILSQERLPLIETDNEEFSYKTMYGLYLESSTAFWVEDNEFFLAWPDELDPYGTPPTIPDFPYTAGLFVRGSGPAQNQIYRNRFYYNDNASVAYDDNRNEDTEDASGLKYTCNEFYYNDNGVNVVSTVNDYNPGWGIHASQGVAPNPPDEGISAGNYFEGQTVNDLRLDGNLPTFSYYWHPTDANFSLQTDGDINEVDQGIGQYNNGQGCPSKLTRTRSARSASADLDKQAAEQFRQQYALLVDGGDTDGLLTEVVLTQYGEALELYYELMAKSPHLSEAVMIEAIQKETELPAALLTLILESNPQAAKSKEVEKKLDERMMPLEEYQRFMIDQGKYLLSNKEMLEARIAYHESEQHAALDEIIIEIMMDSTIVDKRSEIDAEVIGRESLDIRYLRVDLALEDGDVATAQSLLDNIPSDIPLRGLKDQEYVDFVTCYELLIDLLTTESTSLSPVQESDLYLIAIKHSTRASGLAQILLTEYTDYTFNEVLVDPDATAKSNRNWDPRKPKFSNDPSLSIYPNPTADHLVIEFRNWGDEVDLELRDAAGRLVRIEQVTSSKTAYILDVSELSEGSYSLLLRSLDGHLSEQKLIEVIR